MQRSASVTIARGGACRQLPLTPSSGGASGVSVRRQRRAARRLPMLLQAGLFDNLFDFESWAPRSSQAWRLGKNPNAPAEGDDAANMKGEDVDVLNQRLAEARQSRAVDPPALGSAGVAAEAAEQSSFLQSTDDEVASALADRIAEMASAKGTTGSGGSVEGGRLTGPLLRELIVSKWGKTYDVSFVRRDLPLGKTLICLNVMWTHLEQRSFPMSEEEYDEKLDLLALYLNSWGQADRVESFLRQPARPRKGMPSKPIVGIAISIQLPLDDAVIEEFFAQGGA